MGITKDQYTQKYLDLADEQDLIDELNRRGRMSPYLWQLEEQRLIDELIRRGWRYKEAATPVQTTPGGPTYLARQLQHSIHPKKDDT